MAQAQPKPTLKANIDDIVVYLRKHPLKNVHRSDRHKQNVNAYSVLGLKNESGSYELHGHICGPKSKTKEVQYRISDLETLNPQIDVVLNPHSVELSRAIQQIEEELTELLKKAKNENASEKFNTKGWEGFYLNRRVPSTRAKQNFKDAVNSGIISQSFANTCIDINISLYRYKI